MLQARASATLQEKPNLQLITNNVIQPENNYTTTLVFIDTQIVDYQHLLAAALPNIEVLIISSERDGVEQITEILSSRDDVDAVHIVSHGSPGCLHLGNSQLNLNTINYYAELLKSWFLNRNRTIKNIPSVYLYGCRVASGDAGEEFLIQLSNLIKGTIFASNKLTGNGELGGNWELETTIFKGNIQTENARVALPFTQEKLLSYSSVLMIETAYTDMTVVGNYAYLLYNTSDQKSGLQIYDISNPPSHPLIGTYQSQDSTSQLTKVTVVGDWAYIVDQSNSTLQIIDVSDRTNPQLENQPANFSFNTTPTDIAVINNIAYVTTIDPFTGSPDLKIINVSDRANPIVTNNYSTAGNAQALAVANNYLFIADDSSGVKISRINSSDPTQLEEFTTLDVHGTAYEVVVSGNYLSVIYNTTTNISGVDVTKSEVKLFDISGLNSNPISQPTLIGTYTIPDYAGNTSNLNSLTYNFKGDLTIVGNYAYVSYNIVGYDQDYVETVFEQGLKRINLLNPSQEDSYTNYVSDYDIEIVGEYLYTANSEPGLECFNIRDLINRAPTDITPDQYTINSNLSAGTTIGTLTTVDSDTDDVSFKYTLVSGQGDTNNNLFTIDLNTGELKTASALSSNADYTIRVRTTDAGGLYYEEAIKIKGKPINNAPTNITLEDNSVDENQPLETVVGSFTTTDPDTGNTFSYSLVSGIGDTDNALFTIAGNQLKTNSTFDYENKNTYTIRVKTTDQGGLSYEKQFTVNINDLIDLVHQGNYNTPGNAYGVAVGNYAYVADGGSGLQIIDVSNPTAPTLKGAFDTSGNAWGVVVAGNYAYVADYGSGLQILNISNPNSPTLQGTYNTPGLAYGVTVVNNKAYVADGVSGLQIIDISNPNSPTLQGTFDTSGFARGVAVSGNYAYIADGFSGLQIIDISNPNSPILQGTFDTSGYARELVVAGNYAFVADGGSGLQILNISNPNSPTLQGTYNTPGNAWGVTIDGNYAFIADGVSGLQVVDISNPNAPNFITSHDTPGNAYDVKVVGNYAYVADSDKGVQVFNISQLYNNHTPTDLAINNNTIAENQPVGTAIGTLSTTDPNTSDAFTYSLVSGTGDTDNVSFTFDGNQLKANSIFDYETKNSYSIRVRTTDRGGLFVEKQLSVSVSDLSGIYRQGIYDTSGNAYGVTVEGNYAYVADNRSGLQILDVSNPTAPTLKGTYDTSGLAYEVAVVNNTAYVADGNSGLQILDVSNPNSPILKSTYNTSGVARGVAVTGNTAYVADGFSGLQILDVSDPMAPILRGTFNTDGYALGVAVVNNTAYVADGNSGLQILDVSNPTAPTLKGTDVDAYAWGVRVVGNTAYVADENSGLRVLNISDPMIPTLKGTYDTLGSARGVTVMNNSAFIAAGTSGLEIVDISEI